MALYVTLAAEYPQSIIGIFIRDVTTPFDPSPSTPTSPVLHPSPDPIFVPFEERAFSEFPDLPGAFDGPHETPLPFPLPSSVRPIPIKRPSLGARAKSSFLRAARSTPPSSPPLPRADSGPPPPDLEVKRRGTTTPPLTKKEKEEAAVLPSVAAKALVEAFFAKVAAAERILPAHIPLRVFRHGREVKEQGIQLVVENK